MALLTSSNMPLDAKVEAKVQNNNLNIIDRLPVELVIVVFDWLSVPEVMQLRLVCKSWNVKIETQKWKEKAQFLEKTPDNDTPFKLELQVHCVQLSKSLRYLDVSAARLERAWTESLTVACPNLSTLIIRDMNKAPLDGVLLLSGSGIRILKLLEMTNTQCKWWLPYLSSCYSLQELHMSTIIFPFCTAARPRLEGHTFEPQGSLPCLHTLAIEMLSNKVNPVGKDLAQVLGRDLLQLFMQLGRLDVILDDGVTTLAEALRQARRRGLDTERAERVTLENPPVLCAALQSLVTHAPKLKTFKAIDWRYQVPHDTVWHSLFQISRVKDAFEVITLNGMLCEPDWTDKCKSLTWYNVEISSPNLHNLPANTGALWSTDIERLEISYPANCPFGFLKAIPLAHNLQHLKLYDPKGILANGLFYMLLQDGLSEPLTSLKSLSLSRDASRGDLLERITHLTLKPATAKLPDGFDSIGKGDIMRLAAAFPMLVNVELIKVTNVPAATVRSILENRLPELRTLKVVEKDRVEAAA